MLKLLDLCCGVTLRLLDLLREGMLKLLDLSCGVMLKLLDLCCIGRCFRAMLELCCGWSVMTIPRLGIEKMMPWLLRLGTSGVALSGSIFGVCWRLDLRGGGACGVPSQDGQSVGK